MIAILVYILTVIVVILNFYYILHRFLLKNMQSDDARYLKRKVKSGAIDVHPTEKALVVHYELEAVILGELGDPMHGDKKECQKIIRLNNLNSKTDCAALAKDVIDKCSLIHPSKLDEVEQLIYYLKNRKRNSRLSSNSIKHDLSSPTSRPSTAVSEKTCNINNIDEYVELLYEDITKKIKGSQIILEIAKNPDNLEELSRNEAAISALTRVLREDWKKSIDLSTNIVCTLFFFSNYVEFHPVIIHYKIGSLCMYLLTQEFQRYDHWEEELDNLNQDKDVLMTTSGTELKKSRIPEPTLRRPRSGIFAISESQLARAKTAVSANSQEISTDDLNLEPVNNKILSIAKTKKQIVILKRKQEQLIRVLFYLLLNVAEEEKIEEKMAKKNIVAMLMKTLDWQNVELLTLVVTFLKRLSIREINKNEMARLGIIQKLPHLLLLEDAELVHVTLKLLFNLSFDKNLRAEMVSMGLLPKLVGLLSDDKHQNVVLKLLYQFSTQKHIRPMFMYTDCVDLIMDMVLLCKDQMVDIELVALCINLAQDEENAEHIIEKNLLPDLMKRAIRYKDPLLMKMLRNLSRHTFAKNYFLPFVGDMAQSISDNKNPEFSLECVGILGNLNLPDIDFFQIFTRLNLIPWMQIVLSQDCSEDDVVLDVIILLGTAAQDEECAHMLCKDNLVLSTVTLLNAKQVDDEIVLQIVYLFYQILSHENTRMYLIKETDAIAYLIDLMRDKNKVVRKWCNYCLDLVAMADSEWAARIKVEKFRSHNAHWLDMVENHNIDTLGFDEPISEPSVYYHTNFLSNNEIGPGGQRIALDLDTAQNISHLNSECNSYAK